ncbi:MAG: tail fiber protein [Bacteroidetes bacterium]|nr:tail fiber protein [Bacteroidota bacterium]
MEAFIGEINSFAFGFVPQGWLACNGATLQVSANTALYSVIGNNFGGTPGVTFNLPNLNGEIIVGAGTLPGGSNYSFASTGGNENIALHQTSMPNHAHTMYGGITPTTPDTATLSAPNSTTFVSNLIAKSTNQIGKGYQHAGAPNTNVNLAANSIGAAGNDMPHENRAPYLPILFCICVDGLYPVRP